MKSSRGGKKDGQGEEEIKNKPNYFSKLYIHMKNEMKMKMTTKKTTSPSSDKMKKNLC